MERYTPKGVWADTYSDQQRSSIIAQILGDNFYMEHLSHSIVERLESTDTSEQNDALVSVHKFEDRVEHMGGREGFEASKAQPTVLDDTQKERISEILGDEFYLKHLNSTILTQLRSQAVDQQIRGLDHVTRFDTLVKRSGGREEFAFSKLTPEQQEAVIAKREAAASEQRDRQTAERLRQLHGLPEDIKAKLGSPKLATIRKALPLAEAWLKDRKTQREAASLAPLLEQCTELYNQIEELLKQSLSTERRQALQELYDTCEDQCDDPQLLQRWIDKATRHVTRATNRRCHVPQPSDQPERSTNWELLDAKPGATVGRPNPQGGPVTRGAAVPLAGKTSQELTRRGKKKAKK